MDKLCHDIKTKPGMRRCGEGVGEGCEGMPEYGKFIVTDEDDEKVGETCCFPDTKTGKSRGVNDPALVANNQIDLATNGPCVAP